MYKPLKAPVTYINLIFSEEYLILAVRLAIVSRHHRVLILALVLFLFLSSLLNPIVKARHSPDLQTKSRELLEAPKVLAEWLSRVGRDDLRVLLDEAASTNNHTLMKLVITRVLEYLRSDYPVTLFVGGKHLMSLKILNMSSDLTVGSNDLGWLLYYVTRSLNKTGYSSLSNMLLVILSGFVTYGDHNELSYFMIYLMKEPSVKAVSEDLRNELRVQILKFLDYVDSGAYKEAIDFSINVSYSTSMLLGSCMYLIATSYSKYVSSSKLPGGSLSNSSSVLIINEVIESLTKANVSSLLIEILKKLPPEDLNRLLEDINKLEGIDEEILIEEISKYVREKRYNATIIPSSPKTSSITVRVFTAVGGGESSEVPYRFSSELGSLMYLISSTPAFVISSSNSGFTQEASLSSSGWVASGPYVPLLLVISLSSVVGLLFLFRFFHSVKLGLVSVEPQAKPVPQSRTISSYVVRVFWPIIESLCSFFEVSLGRYETHREVTAKLVPKIRVFAGEDAVKLFSDLTKYYELVRFGNVREDEVMVFVAKRVEEYVRSWEQGS